MKILMLGLYLRSIRGNVRSQPMMSQIYLLVLMGMKWLCTMRQANLDDYFQVQDALMEDMFPPIPVQMISLAGLVGYPGWSNLSDGSSEGGFGYCSKRSSQMSVRVLLRMKS